MTGRHNKWEELGNAIASIPRPPCDSCRHWNECLEKELACWDFFSYTSREHAISGRSPSKGVYNRIYKEAPKIERPKKKEEAKKKPMAQKQLLEAARVCEVGLDTFEYQRWPEPGRRGRWFGTGPLVGDGWIALGANVKQSVAIIERMRL